MKECALLFALALALYVAYEEGGAATCRKNGIATQPTLLVRAMTALTGESSRQPHRETYGSNNPYMVHTGNGYGSQNPYLPPHAPTPVVAPYQHSRPTWNY